MLKISPRAAGAEAQVLRTPYNDPLPLCYCDHFDGIIILHADLAMEGDSQGRVRT
jgi:hypothetical protein